MQPDVEVQRLPLQLHDDDGVGGGCDGVGVGWDGLLLLSMMFHLLMILNGVCLKIFFFRKRNETNDNEIIIRII